MHYCQSEWPVLATLNSQTRQCGFETDNNLGSFNEEWPSGNSRASSRRTSMMLAQRPSRCGTVLSQSAGLCNGGPDSVGTSMTTSKCAQHVWSFDKLPWRSYFKHHCQNDHGRRSESICSCITEMAVLYAWIIMPGFMSWNNCTRQRPKLLLEHEVQCSQGSESLMSGATTGLSMVTWNQMLCKCWGFWHITLSS